MRDARPMGVGTDCGLMAAPGRSQIGVSRECCRWVPKKQSGGGTFFFRLWVLDLAADCGPRSLASNCSQLRGCVARAFLRTKLALAPTNGRPGFPFFLSFLGAGGRFAKARRGRFFILKYHHYFPVMAGACQFGTAWAGLRFNSTIHSPAAGFTVCETESLT